MARLKRHPPSRQQMKTPRAIIILVPIFLLVGVFISFNLYHLFTERHYKRYVHDDGTPLRDSSALAETTVVQPAIVSLGQDNVKPTPQHTYEAKFVKEESPPPPTIHLSHVYRQALPDEQEQNIVRMQPDVKENWDRGIEATVQQAGLGAEAQNLAEGLKRYKLVKGMVAITFGDAKMDKHMLNWATNLRKSGIPHIVGALDETMLHNLEAHKVPCYPFFLDEFDGANAHASATWKTFAGRRLSQVRALVHLGYDALMTDIDVAWMADPRPYIYCTGEPLPGDTNCSKIAGADVMVSTDNLGASQDWVNSGTAAYGTCNTGIVFVRSNTNGKMFADAWLSNLRDAPGRFSTLTSDQQVFNMMVREPGKWPGMQMIEKDMRIVESYEPKVKVGILPLALFCNGHGYFVQRTFEWMHLQPYAVHATYTFDGAGGVPKQHRFREAGLWLVEDDEYYAPQRFLTFDGTVPKDMLLADPPAGDLGTHLNALQSHLSGIRGALAVARATGRVLLLPKLTCYCDKTWGGHDNIFKSKCKYPGAEGGDFLPLQCPLDHMLSPSAWVEAGVPFRTESYLRDARVPEAVRDSKIVRMEVVPRDQLGGSGAQLPEGASDDDVHTAFASLEHVPIVELSNARAAFCRFNNASEDAIFEKLMNNIMRPVSWCSECHPEGCAHWVKKETLLTGRVVPTRGVHEMFCRDYQIPPRTCK